MNAEKILLIEDGESNREMAQRRLMEVFPQNPIVIAKNFAEAFQAMQDKSIIAVLTDNLMPRSGEDQELKPRAIDISRHAARVLPGVPVSVWSDDLTSQERQLNTLGAHCCESKQVEALEGGIEFLRRKLQQHKAGGVAV